MSDIICNPYPARAIDPNEPGLVAGYCFLDSELSTFGRYLNRGYGGAVYDLTTRAGVPIVGQGGGIYSRSGFNVWYNPAAIPVGNSNFSYDLECEVYAAVNGYLVGNTAQHFISVTAGGLPYISFDAGVTPSITAFSVVGRGPFRAAALYDGANQILTINGRQADADAVVPGAPAGQFHVGSSGPDAVDRLLKVYSVRRTVAQARASYVREFARKVIYHWEPSAVGEGPAGGIPTNAVGEGDWYCPLGGATLQFAWVTDLSVPGGGYLALTDSGALSMRRLDFSLPRRPMFGSWLVRYRLRNPIFGGDNPRVGFISVRGADMTAAGSQSIWNEGFNTGGGWWRNQLSRENAGTIGVDADHAVTAAGDDGAVLITHHVDGNFRIYSFSRTLAGWFWRQAAVVNDVNFLAYNYISIAPRGSYIKSVTGFQGEMDPHELAMRMP